MTGWPLTARKIAELLGGRLEGDGSVRLEGIAPLDEACPAELTFAEDEKRAKRLPQSKAAAAIVAKVPESAAIPLIRVENVKAAVAKLLGEVGPAEDLPPVGVDGSAVVSPDAEVAGDAAIGPGAVIGAGAKVGAGSALCANVTIGRNVRIGSGAVLCEGVVVRYGCRIGNRVRIGPNSVIGYDGFGYYTEDGVHHKVPHVGDVIVEDDVEIGACSCVDRAKFGSTVIGAGTKIDNLVQVAHNVQVGRGCLLVGQCGIAGSAKLGKHVVIGGNAGIRDNVTLGEGVQCSAFAAVASDVPDGEIVAGIPAGPARETMRVIQATNKLPELIKKVRNMESRLKDLESAKDH